MIPSGVLPSPATQAVDPSPTARVSSLVALACRAVLGASEPEELHCRPDFVPGDVWDLLQTTNWPGVVVVGTGGGKLDFWDIDNEVKLTSVQRHPEQCRISSLLALTDGRVISAQSQFVGNNAPMAIGPLCTRSSSGQIQRFRWREERVVTQLVAVSSSTFAAITPSADLVCWDIRDDFAAPSASAALPTGPLADGSVVSTWRTAAALPGSQLILAPCLRGFPSSVLAMWDPRAEAITAMLHDRSYAPRATPSPGVYQEERGEWPSALQTFPDGTVVSAGQEGVIKLWDLRTGRCESRLPRESHAPARCLSHSCSAWVVACGGADGTLDLVDCRMPGMVVGSLAGRRPGSINDVCRLDDRRLVFVSSDQGIRVLNPFTMTVEKRLGARVDPNNYWDFVSGWLDCVTTLPTLAVRELFHTIASQRSVCGECCVS